jgi:hypothetical protein
LKTRQDNNGRSSATLISAAFWFGACLLTGMGLKAQKAACSSGLRISY